MKISLFGGAAALALTICGVSANAQDVSHQTPGKAQQRADLERQKADIQAQIDALQSAPASAAPNSAPYPASGVAEVVVTGRSQPITTHPIGQTVVSVFEDMLKDTPVFSVGDILKLAPGVSFTQGNGRVRQCGHQVHTLRIWRSDGG